VSSLAVLFKAYTSKKPERVSLSTFESLIPQPFCRSTSARTEISQCNNVARRTRLVRAGLASSTRIRARGGISGPGAGRSRKTLYLRGFRGCYEHLDGDNRFMTNRFTPTIDFPRVFLKIRPWGRVTEACGGEIRSPLPTITQLLTNARLCVRPGTSRLYHDAVLPDSR
jgi:hypothetical protein